MGRKMPTVGLRDALQALNNELVKIEKNVEPIPVKKREPKKAPAGSLDEPIVGDASPTS